MRQTEQRMNRGTVRAANVGTRSRSTSGWFGRAAAIGFVALGLTAGCGAQNYAQPPNPCVTSGQADVLAENLLRLINMERTLEDVDPLAWDDDLAKVAQQYSCRMIEGRFFGHVDPATKAGPDHRLNVAGYDFIVMGENLAVGQTTAAEVLDSWMESPSHCDNILSAEWTRIGIGVRADEGGTLHWVLELADPV